MKKILLIFFLLFNCNIENKSDHIIFIADKTSTIDQKFINKANIYLRNLHKDLNLDIRILLVNSDGIYSPVEYSEAAIEQFQIGGELNNGVLILFYINERYLRIATGTGIELYLSDLSARRIIDDMIPSLSENEMEKAISIAISEIENILKKVSWKIEEKNIEIISNQDINKIFKFKGFVQNKKNINSVLKEKYKADYILEVKVKNKNIFLIENQYIRKGLYLEKHPGSTITGRLISIEPETYEFINVEL
jgi:hypothetical protein